MTIVDNMELMREWMLENVCKKVRYKIPDDNCTDEEYEYRLDHPACFAFMQPTADKLPVNVLYDTPCVVLQAMSGHDDPHKKIRQTNVRLWVSVWDPGRHGNDIYVKSAIPDVWTQWAGPEASAYFQTDGNGWKDLWNFVDVILRELENAEFFAGQRLCKEQAITWGPFQEADVIVNTYPYYIGWVNFTVESPLVNNLNKDLQEIFF